MGHQQEIHLPVETLAARDDDGSNLRKGRVILLPITGEVHEDQVGFQRAEDVEMRRLAIAEIGQAAEPSRQMGIDMGQVRLENTRSMPLCRGHRHHAKRGGAIELAGRNHRDTARLVCNQQFSGLMSELAWKNAVCSVAAGVGETRWSE